MVASIISGVIPSYLRRKRSWKSDQTKAASFTRYSSLDSRIWKVSEHMASFGWPVAGANLL
jgi:hypothetical protein